jgi:Ca-activated chloride channel family protein
MDTEGRVLPLLSAALRAEASGGVARVVLEQRFHNPYEVPLCVTYSLPLPADGAVSGFAFHLGARRIVGEIDRCAAARERFEEALLEGRSAAILEQDRSSLFTQELGNIPPGEEVVAEIVVDQRLRWLAEGAWEWRFPTAVGPRYLGGPRRVGDAARITEELTTEALGARLTLALAVRDTLASGKLVESPSHPLLAESPAAIRFREHGVALDRDVVVRWCVATDAIGSALETARLPEGGPLASSAYGLLTLVPPRTSGTPVGRDVVVLLDTSGSMAGEPLAQACRVLSAVVESLEERDALEMIQFSTAPRRWRREPAAVTQAVKREALEWLASRSASGGTEMRDGIVEALRAVRPGSQRQVILVTDGFIGFEAEVVGAIARRSFKGTRVHAVGVGSAVNRSLTSAAARAGGGLEIIVGLGEDAEPAARRIVACTQAPLVVDLEIGGSAFVAHAGLPDLFFGMPALLPLSLRPEGGALNVRGRSAEGVWEARLNVGAVLSGSGRAEVVALFGREKVEDLEARVAAGESEIDPQIEKVGLDFGIATRLTSWVAVSEEPSVDPRSPLRRERMPQQLPYGVSVEGVGLRAASAPARALGGAAFERPRAMASSARHRITDAAPAPGVARKQGAVSKLLARGVRSVMSLGQAPPVPQAPPAPSPAASVTFREFDAPQGKGQPERALGGRLVRRDGEKLVLEIEIDALPLDWELPSTVLVDWSDGAQSQLAVDPAKTTCVSTQRPGERARVVLQLGATDKGRDPRVVHLTLSTAILRVTL